MNTVSEADRRSADQEMSGENTAAKDSQHAGRSPSDTNASAEERLFSDLRVFIRQTLIQAQVKAKSIKREAEDDAERLIEAANAQAESILHKAREDSDATISQARANADSYYRKMHTEPDSFGK